MKPGTATVHDTIHLTKSKEDDQCYLLVNPAFHAKGNNQKGLRRIILHHADNACGKSTAIGKGVAAK